jgi:hypothetical protein
MVRTAARQLAYRLARLAVASAFAAIRLADRLAGAAGLDFEADLAVAVEVPARPASRPAPEATGPPEGRPDLRSEPGFPADFFGGPEEDGVPEPLISERVVAAYLASEAAPKADPE